MLRKFHSENVLCLLISVKDMFTATTKVYMWWWCVSVCACVHVHVCVFAPLALVYEATYM